MWKMNNSIKKELIKYFLLFSIVILSILWIFQFISFRSFYKDQRKKDLQQVAKKIEKNQSSSNFYETINTLALDKSVCIEIDNSNYYQVYNSTYFGKGCSTSKEETYKYKFDFINSNQKEKTYEQRNQKDQTDTMIVALRLDSNHFIFISTSVEPTESITALILKQLVVITILIVILSLFLASIISNHLSKPIKEINENAKKLAKKDFTSPIKNTSKILELSELSSTLQYAQKELSKTEELRRDLMANISHDLKTPLTMIKANAEICKDLHQNNKEKREQDMNTIISEVDRLTILVNDILTLSKMESMTEELKIEEIDLKNMIKEILQRYSILEETEKYTFDCIFPKEKVIISADKKKLEQVLYNLINNAINYTGEDNKVTIKVSNKENIKVEIIDTGKGIKEKDIPYIWDKYYKNQKKHKRNLVGTGLGLSIVKKILEEHHFPYGVKSKSNKGTTFYFEIPKEKEK